MDGLIDPFPYLYSIISLSYLSLSNLLFSLCKNKRYYNQRFGSTSGSGSTSISFLGSGSTFSKCGSEDPDPLLRKGGSEDSDPLFPNVDPRIRIRIHVKMRWIQTLIIMKVRTGRQSIKNDISNYFTFLLSLRKNGISFWKPCTKLLVKSSCQEKMSPKFMKSVVRFMP